MEEHDASPTLGMLKKKKKVPRIGFLSKKREKRFFFCFEINLVGSFTPRFNLSSNELAGKPNQDL